MAAGFEVTGSKDLATLARRCKEVGEGELRKQLLRGTRASAKKAIPDIRQSAEDRLPRRGGLNVDVAERKYVVRARYAATGAVVRIVGTGMRQLKLIDSGFVRHKVFGQWVRGVPAEEVNSGYFTDPLLARRPQFLRDVEQVVHDVARQITRSI